MKSCPLWSIFSAMGIERQKVTKGSLRFGTYEPLEVQPCIGEQCGIYGLCNPLGSEAKEKEKEENKELKVFGGGHAKEDKD